jgi:hypothetical protein
MDAEISFDLVMEECMAFVEGCYRLPERSWEVFTINKHPVAEPKHHFCRWQSGVTGLALHVPKETNLNKVQVERLLSSILQVKGWRTVRGPDSMELR